MCVVHKESWHIEWTCHRHTQNWMNGCNQADEHSNLYQRWWPCHRWVKKFGHHSTIPSNFPFLDDSRWQRTCHYSLVTASWSPANCWQSLREYASQPENWPFLETGAGLSLYTFIVTQNYIEAALISPWGTPTKLLLEKNRGDAPHTSTSSQNLCLQAS